MPLSTRRTLPSWLGKPQVSPSSSRSTTLPTFTPFPRLPNEIRNKIWALTICEPRILQVVRSPSHRPTKHSYTVVPASYGGHHYATLSVNRDSRSEALRHLNWKWNAYWNMECDLPYLECKFKDDDAITQLVEMRKNGALGGFKTLVLDCMYWNWDMATHSMEFKVTFRGKFDAYEHPIKIIDTLPDLKKVFFIIIDHTLQKDLVAPYVSWRLGPLTAETCLSDDTDEYWGFRATEKYTEEDFKKRRMELKTNVDVEIEIMSIHQRTREFLPLEKLRRPTQVWELDWFGEFLARIAQWVREGKILIPRFRVIEGLDEKFVNEALDSYRVGRPVIQAVVHPYPRDDAFMMILGDHAEYIL